ncbi:sensor domain-containing diguanylate cyclase [Bordetella bronchialis]|uniref:diguanylate cyclase n=1 Tax=Bordetella bronchialis TaxID=463025 RepID=A0A193G0C6_9BORD|nr:sensor domain-containing diguanylate cyclase [Bordetella bronchialis]ANN68317.1 hypothetical protein BAU06_20225 [Bordetella bronchialis]ANN73457.1 hypothetical protein BAU08_20755 [Bordetella bronchialis]
MNSHAVIRLSNALAAVIVLGAIVGAGAFLMHDRRESWRHAAAGSRSMAAMLEADIARTVRVYDLTLMGVIETLGYEHLDKMPPDAVHRLMFERAAMTDYMGAMVVLDERGDIRFDVRPGTPRRGNFADRDYFEVHRAHSDVGLYISKPLTNRLRNGEPGIALSRRLSHPDGSFAGVAVAILRTAYLNNRFAQVALEPDESVTLFREDGIVLWRWPNGVDSMGKDAGGQAVHLGFQAAKEGGFVVPSDDGGPSRYYTYDHVAGLPLVITIAQPAEDITEPWRRRAWFIVPFTMLFCAAMVILAYLVRRTMRNGDRQLARWAELARTDGLTGLLNRRAFDAVLAEAWRVAATEGMPLSLLFIDADHFKRFNDIHGHQAGDDFLRRLAGVIRGCTRRPRDASARYGGEEFVLLLRDTTGVEALPVAEDIRKKVEAMHVSNADGWATVSIGVASSAPAVGGTPAMLVAKADEALYQAKTHGRNKVHLAEGRNGMPQRCAIPDPRGAGD